MSNDTSPTRTPFPFTAGVRGVFEKVLAAVPAVVLSAHSRRGPTVWESSILSGERLGDPWGHELRVKFPFAGVVLCVTCAPKTEHVADRSADGTHARVVWCLYPIRNRAVFREGTGADLFDENGALSPRIVKVVHEEARSPR